MKRSVLYIVGVLLLGSIVLWSLGLLGPTWVTFQSSDGEWADSEILMKGRDFETLVTRFELYRAKCNPAAALQRTTERPSWWMPEHWFNDYSEPKWLLPYSSRGAKTALVYYPPASAQHCANRPATLEEVDEARARARELIASLPNKPLQPIARDDARSG
jgi:hypothetical protein